MTGFLAVLFLLLSLAVTPLRLLTGQTWLVQFRDPADPPLTDQHTHSLGQGLMLAGTDPTGRAGQAR